MQEVWEARIGSAGGGSGALVGLGSGRLDRCGGRVTCGACWRLLRCRLRGMLRGEGQARGGARGLGHDSRPVGRQLRLWAPSPRDVARLPVVYGYYPGGASAPPGGAPPRPGRGRPRRGGRLGVAWGGWGWSTVTIPAGRRLPVTSPGCAAFGTAPAVAFAGQSAGP